MDRELTTGSGATETADQEAALARIIDQIREVQDQMKDQRNRPEWYLTGPTTGRAQGTYL